MKRKFIIIFLSLCLAVTGCGVKQPEDEELSTETEMPSPDVIDDLARSVSYLDVCCSYNLMGEEAFGVDCEDDYFTVYENRHSYNYAKFTLAYMPNYNKLIAAGSNSSYRDMGDGYVIYTDNFGLPEEEVTSVLNGIVRE